MPSKWRLRNVTWVQLLKLTCHEAGFERADFQVKSGQRRIAGKYESV
jgi:hypothetical protein